MKKIQLFSMAALPIMALVSARAAVITDLGTSIPATNQAIASHTVPVTPGNREVGWYSTTVHSLGGQSFTATKTAIAESITLKVTSAEDWANWDTSSFKIKVFKGVGSSGATELGSYSYNATGLGAAANSWLKFGLGAGLAMTNGVQYSFVIVCGALNPTNRVNFGRDGNSDAYPDGNELRGGNAYDIVNFDTDPWDVAEPIGQTVDTNQSGDMLFVINELLLVNIPPVADSISKTTLKNTAVGITLSGSDANGNPLTFAVQTSPINGTLTGTAPDLTYTPDTDFSGSDSFTYVANDGTTNSAPATVSLTVLAGSGLMDSVGAADPAIANPELIGTAVAGFSREIIRTDSQTFVVGQTFTLAESQTVSEIYLQSAAARDFTNFTGAVEVKVFSGEGASATLVNTSVFDVLFNNHPGDDVLIGDWVRFTLQAGGATLPAGTNSFLVYWSQKAGGNKWGFNRNKTATSYPGGMQVEYTAQSGDAYPQWDADPWAPVVFIAANDLTFYINTGAAVQPTAEQLYGRWVSAAGLSGVNTNMAADIEPDGMDNLLEYALGGNPTNNDAAIFLPVSKVDGAWLNYVYNRRDDAAARGLTYQVLSTTDLVYGPITNATAEVGASAAVNGFQSVTNRIPTTVEGKQFMKLKVELN